MKRNHVGLITYVVVTLLAAASARAFPIVIDDFGGGPHLVLLAAASPPETNSASFLYPGAVGGERDIIVIGETQGGFLAGVAFDVGGYGSGFDGEGQGAIIWDGVDGDPLVNAQGLGGLNLLGGCSNPVLNVTAFADLPHAFLHIFAFTTAADYALWSIPLTTVGAFADYSVPLGAPTSTLGSPNLSNVNSLAMFIDGTGFPNLDIRVTGLDITCPGNPRTIGFWGNKNGEATILALIASGVDVWGTLNAMNLRDGAGNHVTFTTFAEFKAWLRAASATNMAYMLSAQLAAMQLNVLAGFVSTSATLSGPGFPDPSVTEDITVGDLIDAAVAALAADGYTPSGDPNRPFQTYLKNVLDAGNNGGGGFGGYFYL